MTRRSRKGKDRQLKNVLLHYDRADECRNRLGLTEDNRKRNAGTRKIDCPFERFASKCQGQWFLNARINEHNHDLDVDDLSGHPSACALTNDQHIMEQINARYVELAPHQQVAVRRNLLELLYCPSELIQSPLRQERTRGRPAGAVNRRTNDSSSTRREPSGFELI
ncbi:hypothetical protein BDB00DRAFT_869372 [Zychaea mexicana]|uniref:uncharacterized protein n=1 Tax=Zychaea mexicana TaxID=64656 RepID=UPI0022FF266F|nr:uncharacterized protein BDB00DRAFT_869372 [Zychaea mexicana]KAI9496433.1 hypothetical protein BDB00DRAFT_869372 [Zychaea mexicana]